MKVLVPELIKYDVEITNEERKVFQKCVDALEPILHEIDNHRCQYLVHGELDCPEYIFRDDISAVIRILINLPYVYEMVTERE